MGIVYNNAFLKGPIRDGGGGFFNTVYLVLHIQQGWYVFVLHFATNRNVPSG